MTITLWVATIGALLAVPISAFAQQANPAPDPADPRVAVPAALYESAFARVSGPRPQENGLTPDKVWKTANATVAATSGHAGHGGGALQAGSDAHAGHAAPATAAKPAVQPVADHSKHH